MAVVCQKGQKSAADPTPNQDHFEMHTRITQIFYVQGILMYIIYIRVYLYIYAVVDIDYAYIYILYRYDSVYVYKYICVYTLLLLF